MRAKDIRVLVLDNEGNETDNRDFETIKEARAWVKDCGLSADYWYRASESLGYAERNVETIRLVIDGEIVKEWENCFPEYTSTQVNEVNH